MYFKRVLVVKGTTILLSTPRITIWYTHFVLESLFCFKSFEQEEYL